MIAAEEMLSNVGWGKYDVMTLCSSSILHSEPTSVVSKTSRYEKKNFFLPHSSFLQETTSEINWISNIYYIIMKSTAMNETARLFIMTTHMNVFFEIKNSQLFDKNKQEVNFVFRLFKY